MLLARSSSSINAVFISVATYPGAIALTEMPFPAHSFDRAFVSCVTPPLEAAYAGTVKPPLRSFRVVSISFLSTEAKVLDAFLRNTELEEIKSGALTNVRLMR